MAPWLLPLLSVGTAAVYARLVWVPLQPGTSGASLLQLPGPLLLVTVLLLAPLVGAGSIPALGQGSDLVKSLAVLAAGAGVEALRRLFSSLRLPAIRLPDLEKLGDLLGGMAVVGAGLVLVLQGGALPLRFEQEVLAWRG